MLKVLIADDDMNVGRCLRQLVDWEGLGYEIVSEAYDGETAYRMALETKPDVIISDIKMPFMDGTELCREIRAVMCNVVIIFLSAYEDFSTARLALKYGVKEYILKPIDMNKINALAEILREIRTNIEQSSSFERLLNDKDAGNDVLNRLKNSDIQYFNQLFDTLNNSNTGDFAIIRALCFKLINILYDYLQAIGVSDQLIEKRRQRIDDDMMELKMIKDMVFYTRKLFFDVVQCESDTKDDYYRVLIHDIKEYIRENYSEESFNVSCVAERFKFSLDYIGKLFKHYTGTVISNYITDVRLEKAAELLRETSLSLNDIASMVGYSSSGYFTKVFKLKESITPSEYRNKINSLHSGLAR